MEDQATLNSNNRNKPKAKTSSIFRIVKVDRANDYLQEILGESGDEIENFQSDPFSKDTRSTFILKRRVDPSSKVNFAKLSNEEKEKRLKNLAVLVKKMKRKLKNINKKLKKNASKLLNKFLKDYLRKHRSEFSKNNFKELPLINYDDLSSAISMFYNHNAFEFEDEKYLIQNILLLISGHKLNLNSLEFKHICSIVRSLLSEESAVGDKTRPLAVSQIEQEYISRFMRKISNGEKEMVKEYSNFLLCKEEVNEKEYLKMKDYPSNPLPPDGSCSNNNILTSMNFLGNQFNGFVPFILDNRNYFNTFNTVPFSYPLLGNFQTWCNNNNNVSFNNNSNCNNSISPTEMLNSIVNMLNPRNTNTNNPTVSCNNSTNSYERMINEKK